MESREPFQFRTDNLTRYTVHGRGAKSPLGSNYQVTTTSKKLTILSKKCPKSGPKSGPNPVRFPTVIRKVACFWTVFFKTFKSSVSNLHCSVPCVTRTYPQYRNSRKSVTHKQTNGTSSFWLSHERKGASRKNTFEKWWNNPIRSDRSRPASRQLESWRRISSS